MGRHQPGRTRSNVNSGQPKIVPDEVPVALAEGGRQIEDADQAAK
jgi:hypothetical protein